MQRIPPASTIVAYFDFVFKTSIAATMFPHLCQRLFAARSEAVMRRGMSMMNFRWGCKPPLHNRTLFSLSGVFCERLLHTGVD
jgi:hypothetical protein